VRAGQVVQWILYHHRSVLQGCLFGCAFPSMLRPLSCRPFSTSLSRSFPRQLPARATSQFDGDIPRSLRQAAQTEEITSEDFREAHRPIRTQWSLDDIVENENDSPSTGHLCLAQQRQSLHYLRLIEHEMPKLVGECNLFHASLDHLTVIPHIQPFANRSTLRRQKPRSLSGPCLIPVKSIPPL
jgi:hypothetical protein